MSSGICGSAVTTGGHPRDLGPPRYQGEAADLRQLPRPWIYLLGLILPAFRNRGRGDERRGTLAAGGLADNAKGKHN